MRLIQNVKFPVSILLASNETSGNPFEQFDVLTDAVVEAVGAAGFTKNQRLSCGARVSDAQTGKVVFLQGFAENAKLILNLKAGDVIHARGERKMMKGPNGAISFNLDMFLDEAPIIMNGRFAESKKTPADADVLDPLAVEDEELVS